jgi:hypothetical protein
MSGLIPGSDSGLGLQFFVVEAHPRQKPGKSLIGPYVLETKRLHETAKTTIHNALPTNMRDESSQSSHDCMLACDLRRIHSGKASSKVPVYAYTLWIHKDRRFEPVKAALMKLLMTVFEVLAH